MNAVHQGETTETRGGVGPPSLIPIGSGFGRGLGWARLRHGSRAPQVAPPSKGWGNATLGSMGSKPDHHTCRWMRLAISGYAHNRSTHGVSWSTVGNQDHCAAHMEAAFFADWSSKMWWAAWFTQELHTSKAAGQMANLHVNAQVSRAW